MHSVRNQTAWVQLVLRVPESHTAHSPPISAVVGIALPIWWLASHSTGGGFIQQMLESAWLSITAPDSPWTSYLNSWTSYFSLSKFAHLKSGIIIPFSKDLYLIIYRKHFAPSLTSRQHTINANYKYYQKKIGIMHGLLLYYLWPMKITAKSNFKITIFKWYEVV